MQFNYQEFGGRLINGKFCQLASGTKSIMGPANHRISSAPTYPFNVFGEKLARFLKDRFDEEWKDLLLRWRWWDLAPEWLEEVKATVRYMEEKAAHYEAILAGLAPDDTNPKHWTAKNRPIHEGATPEKKEEKA